MSASVPVSKLSVICARPAAVELDEKNRSPSIPVSCCSITWVTVEAVVSAEAPGKVAVTLTEGGAMPGYCATGRVMIASTPTPMIRIEITQAKTGRSMKKRAIARPCPPDFSVSPARSHPPGWCRLRPLRVPRA